MTKKILIYKRKYEHNYGDLVLADCCKYLIEKTARECGIPVKISVANVNCRIVFWIKFHLRGTDIVVYPGGGLNDVEFNKMLIELFGYAGEGRKETEIYINAVGITRKKPRKENEKLLKQLFNIAQVKQVTTRGDIEKLENYINTPKPYPPKLVFDAAVWSNEAYQIERDSESDTIGIGLIRPEIFSERKMDISEEQATEMYANIIEELEKRGYQWQFFSNGLYGEYRFGVQILKKMGRNRHTYIGSHFFGAKKLVEKIAGYKAVIAARMHANIIATSLGIPSVGLVWNDKMNMFAEMIGCPERYIAEEKLMCGAYIVDRMEAAMREGYDMERINAMKMSTIETIRNIILPSPRNRVK